MADSKAGRRKSKPASQTPKAKGKPLPANPRTESVENPSDFWNQTWWRWLFSIRVGIVLLACLTVASIAGTLIAPLERAQKVVFYSWWYKTLLVALAVNMSCATIRTISRRVLPPLRTRIRRSPQYFAETQPSTELKGYRGDAEQVADAFRKKGFAVATEGNFGYAIKGRLGRWGAPISHLGLIVVLLSGFASNWFAKEGYVQVLEGQQTDSMRLRTDPPEQVPLGFTIRVDDFETDYFPRTQIPSKFVSTVTVLDKQQVLYQGPVEVNHSPRIHGWSIHQTSYQEVPQWGRFRIAVSHRDGEEPSVLELSPGQKRSVPGLPGITVQMNDRPPLRWELANMGDPVAQGTFGSAGDAEGPVQLRAERFEPDFVIGPNREISSRSQELNNPALQVVLLSGGQEIDRQWLFGRQDMKSMMHAGASDFEMELQGVEGDPGERVFHVDVRDKQTKVSLGHFDLSLGDTVQVTEEAPAAPAAEDQSPWDVELLEKTPGYVTVLSLSRNPMIPIIYTGCGFMMLGLLVAFFVLKKEVWFRLDPRSNFLQVAATYRYSRMEMDPHTQAALDLLAHTVRTVDETPAEGAVAGQRV
jgi:cytochrome c biogenesis protein ResB